MASASRLLNELSRVRGEIDRVSAPLLVKIEERTKELRMEARALEEQVREATLRLGTTVHGKTLMAVYVVRVSWDTKRMEGYAKAHPEVLAFRKESAGIQIRRVERKYQEESE